MLFFLIIFSRAIVKFFRPPHGHFLSLSNNVCQSLGEIARFHPRAIASPLPLGNHSNAHIHLGCASNPSTPEALPQGGASPNEDDTITPDPILPFPVVRNLNAEDVEDLVVVVARGRKTAFIRNVATNLVFYGIDGINRLLYLRSPDLIPVYGDGDGG